MAPSQPGDTLVRDAIAVVADHELSKLQSGRPSLFAGKSLCRLLFACSVRKGRHLGLAGDLAPLLLRWGHCQWSLVKAFTCCPERQELLSELPPGLLAGMLSERYLMNALDVGGHLRKVSPGWLNENIADKVVLFKCLKGGDHLRATSPDWLVQKLGTDVQRVTALHDGGHLMEMSTEWLCANIECNDSLAWALHRSGKLNDMATALVEARYPCFEEFVQCLCNTDCWCEPEWLFAVYNRHYREYNAGRYPPNDLAEALISMNTMGRQQGRHIEYDLEQLLRQLTFVDAELVRQVVVTVDTLAVDLDNVHSVLSTESAQSFLHARGFARDEDTYALAIAVAERCHDVM